MKLLHRIGKRINSNFNTLEEIISLPHYEPLSFDGVYSSLFWNAHLLGERDVTLFIIGKHIGYHNKFDTGQPFGTFCDWSQIGEMVERWGFKLGFHSWSHKDLTTLSDEEVREEVTPPFPMKYFAYPGGCVDQRVAKIVEEAGYESAWSVHQGDGTKFQKKRFYLNW